MLSGPDFIANLSDGLKVIDLFSSPVTTLPNCFFHKFETFEAAFWPL